jgi:acyl-CoA reductase-like NAD-dependent aldehyde dehydrogenase
MELGGKSANIVFASADLDRALDAAMLSIFANNGQQCLAGSRILVERGVFEDFTGRFAERAAAMRVGDPLDDATELGPLASAPHMNRVLGFAETARSEGCRILTGGARREDLGTGYFIQPTAVVAPSNAARVAQEEVFGPFATFLPFDSAEEAISIANDSAYGLVAYVWSDHLPTVMTMTDALRTGVVWVNTPMMRELRAPFGGYKASGVGREGGAACEAFYTEERTVTIPTIPPKLPRLGASGA